MPFSTTNLPDSKLPSAGPPSPRHPPLASSTLHLHPHLPRYLYFRIHPFRIPPLSPPRSPRPPLLRPTPAPPKTPPLPPHLQSSRPSRLDSAPSSKRSTRRRQSPLRCQNGRTHPTRFGGKRSPWRRHPPWACRGVRLRTTSKETAVLHLPCWARVGREKGRERRRGRGLGSRTPRTGGRRRKQRRRRRQRGRRRRGKPRRTALTPLPKGWAFACGETSRRSSRFGAFTISSQTEHGLQTCVRPPRNFVPSTHISLKLQDPLDVLPLASDSETDEDEPPVSSSFLETGIPPEAFRTHAAPQAARDSLGVVTNRILSHAGFDGTARFLLSSSSAAETEATFFLGASATAVGVLAHVASEYLMNLGLTMRFYADRYGSQMSTEVRPRGPGALESLR